MRQAVANRLGVRNDRGAQLVEFAVSLPLLVVFVVGIFDFSGAFTLKQQLTNVVRDAARVAAADPASDVPSSTGSVPASVSDAYQLIANYFSANNINFCGITASSFANSGVTWTYSGSGNGCPGSGLTIVINRGYYLAESTGDSAPTDCTTAQTLGSNVAVIGTCVNIQYAYQWKFGKVSSLFGTRPTLPSSINAIAVAMNEN
jgi:Flp pilus assembly protein TadG